MEVSMSFKNQSLVSDVQLNLDLTAEDLNQDTDCTDHTEENDQLLNLLAEILEEEFGFKPDDSFEVMEDRFIYNLDSEKDIQSRERYEQEQLDEGSPNVDNVDQLELVAQAYFSNPNVYSIVEESNEVEWVTAFVQQYKGATFDSQGNFKENWRSIGSKIIFEFDDLFHPERLYAMAETKGYFLNDTLRMVIYSPSLESLIGSKIYRPKEAKEFIPLLEGNYQILLATPSMEDCESEDSIYDWINKEIQDGILYGIQPNVSRSTIGHWELTQARLEEIQEEELEKINLLHFSKKETLFVKKQNEFLDRYKEAREFIIGINSGKDLLKTLYTLKPTVLEDILYLAEKCNERINNATVYIQVRSLVTKYKVQMLKDRNSIALSILQKINRGELVEVHLLNLTVLEEIFSVLWSNLGIRILPDRKEYYFQLKDRLLRLRSAKSGKSA